MKYAVVREGPSYKFAVWHDSLESAREEAVRLSERERCRFYVLEAVGHAEVVDVKWVPYCQEAE